MNNKSPLLAGLLNLIFPGLGAAYIGWWARIFSEFLAAILLLILWMFGFLLVGLLDNVQKIMYFNLGFILLYGLAMFLDGRQAAQIHNRKTYPK